MLNLKVSIINEQTKEEYAYGNIQVIDPIKDICSATVTIKASGKERNFGINTLFNIKVEIQEFCQGYICNYSRDR